MVYIISQLTEPIAKKILANKETGKAFLTELAKVVDIPELRSQTATWINGNVWKLGVTYWDYEKSKTIIRELFRKTAKYQRGKEAVVSNRAANASKLGSHGLKNVSSKFSTERD